MISDVLVDVAGNITPHILNGSWTVIWKRNFEVFHMSEAAESTEKSYSVMLRDVVSMVSSSNHSASGLSSA